jgi:phosphoribosylformylglycinamidine synthase
MKITKEILKKHNLTDAEFEKIKSLLGRDPNYTELGVFSAMWNEHVSYKSSRIHLKKFSTFTKRVMQGPGENAGIIDVGENHAICFKMESHNHPSYIEPFQGAATGVGGILRDIFTMGARPIASLDSLRFGSMDHPRTGYLVRGVVQGIGFYGNCMGVPTVGGEMFFDPSYNGNCLVNAFTIGIVRHDRIRLARASGAGSPVIYVGSRTGRDGIHGSSMASESFDEKSVSRRPTVQVGDPFTEKVLLEACLELFEKDHIVGIQDMGASGLTCSTFEMASRGSAGMNISLDRIPVRAKNMTPYEMLLSESQERMLIVARKGHEKNVQKIFHKWDIEAEVIGEVREGGLMEMFHNGEKVVDLPVSIVADHAPVYERKIEEPEDLKQRQSLDILSLPQPDDYGRILLELIGSVNLCSRKPVFTQYDHSVQVRTILGPEASDAAVMRLNETGQKAVALTSDGNGRMTYLDPYCGGLRNVAEAALNLACSGAEPLGLTDCLNFGNPENPSVMWEFERAVQGIADACRFFNIPVVSGNVSFYNETEGKSIFPTPVIAMTGIIEDSMKVCGSSFKDQGSLIAVAGSGEFSVSGSEYLMQRFSMTKGRPVGINLSAELALHCFLREIIKKGFIESAHDISDGGIAVALMESAIGTGRDSKGFSVDLSFIRGRTDEILFGEGPTRVIISFNPEQEKSIVSSAERFKVPLKIIGMTSDSGAEIKPFLKIDLEDALCRWQNGLKGIL